MRRYTFLGINRERTRGCLLTCLLPFDQLEADDLQSSDFKHTATNWNGCDDIDRTLSLYHLHQTGREMTLPKPLVFHGTDLDMGHHYEWAFPVHILAELTD